MRSMRNHGSQGSTFISVTIFSFILFAMSAGFLVMTTSEYKSNRRSRDGAAAINLAEAGVDYAIWTLNLPETDPEYSSKNISTWEGSDALRTKSINSFQDASGNVMGNLYMEVADSTGQNPIVTSTGYAASPANISRKVRVKLSSRYFEPFKGVFFGNQYVHLHGTTSTDSYDHPNGTYGLSNGDIATYGTIIDLTGDSVVNGDAATGPDGTVSNPTAVQGTITDDQIPESDPPLPAVAVPSELVSLTYGINGQFTDGLLTRTGSGTAEIPPGDWKLKRIKLTASAVVTITGPARIYLTGDTGDSIAQTGASSKIICKGKVEFYVDQQVTSSGQGIINESATPDSDPDPANCIIWGTSTCTSIKMSGGSSTYSVVYAPAATIDPSGGGNRYGAYVGKAVDCSGSGHYHYDEALGKVGIGNATGYEPSYWQEK